MRLLLVGAFAYPHAQGSQVYFREQALALRAAGAEVHLLTYGPGPIPATEPPDPVGLPELPQTTLPAWAAPRSRRSGPTLGKPLADLVLAATLRRLVGAPEGAPPAASASASFGASSSAPNASTRTAKAASSAASWTGSSALPSPARDLRGGDHGELGGGFDAILAHHAEAALAAIHGLPRARPPVVYCAHTLLGQELPLYFQRDTKLDRSVDGAGDHGRAEAGSRGAIARLGLGIDRWIARRADGWIALTQASERVIRASSDAPGQRIGPPVADPNALGERHDDARLLGEHGLAPGGFFLYCGNLDPYQDLPLLEQVARRRALATPSASPKRERLPLVVASHSGAGAAGGDRPGSAPALARRLEQAGVRLVAIRSVAEARALFAGARATVVPRRSLGGFPIKLVNSLAAGTPVVAFHGDEWGLVDGHEALIGDPADPVASLTAALARLELDPALADRLGRGARARYDTEHRPALVASATLELIRAVLARRGR